MLLKAVIAVSCLLGLSAAVLALRLRRFTGRSPVPMLITAALGGAAVYHAVRLITLVVGDSVVLPRLAAELLVLLVFLAVNAALLMMGPLFERAGKAAQERAESEKRYRNLFQNTHVGVYRTTPEGRILMANPALVRMLGYESFQELAERDLEKQGFAPQYSRKRFKELVERPGGVSGFESAWITKDGRPRYIRENASAVRDKDGRVIYYEGTVEDITERKAAETELKNSEERYRVLVELSPLGIVVHREGRALFVNPAAAGILGLKDPESLIGSRVLDYVHPDHQERAAERITAVAQDGVVAPPTQFVYLREDGTQVDVETVSAPVTFQGGRAISTVFLDITKRKRAEAIEEQIKAAQKMEALGRLAGGVAHDFNNLLTAIMGYSSLLLEQVAQGDPLRPSLEEVFSAGKRAELLTAQLLAFSRRQVLEPTNLDLNRIITGMEAMLHRLIGEDVELVTDLAPKLDLVKADQAQMEQVIINLVVNARDSMPEGGRITIRTKTVQLEDETPARKPLEVKPGPFVMIEVSDTGEGMSEEVRSHLFEPFFTTKAQGKGTGLGLSTVYGIVQQSSGAIRINSEPGIGSTFQVYLPRSRATRPRPRPPKAKAAPAPGTEHVLLVEDENAVRTLSRKVLEGQGYSVVAASNGVEALALLDAHDGPIDILVTDVVMPEMNGRVLADRIRTRSPDTRVLFVSGYTDEKISIDGGLPADSAFLQNHSRRSV